MLIPQLLMAMNAMPKMAYITFIPTSHMEEKAGPDGGVWVSAAKDGGRQGGNAQVFWDCCSIFLARAATLPLTAVRRATFKFNFNLKLNRTPVSHKFKLKFESQTSPPPS